MTPKLSDELRHAISQQPGRPLTIEDEKTHAIYVLISLEMYRQLQATPYDDSEWDPNEAMPLIAQAFAGPEGWDAPGMEVYDQHNTSPPPTDAESR